MKSLRPDWLTEGLIDFEYKKYILLAYLKYVKDHFQETKLYPPLAEMVSHYHQLVRLKENKESLSGLFPREINNLDPKKLELTYNKLIKDSEALHVVSEIINYSLPHFQKLIEEGKSLYDYLEENIQLEPVGLVPLYKREGYLLLCEEDGKHLNIFRYKLSLIHTEDGNYQSLMTQFLLRERRKIASTFEQVKLNLIKSFQELPNPAAYALTSKYPLPLKETYLPIAKRLLMKQLSEQAA